jgi:hypothetical protein
MIISLFYFQSGSPFFTDDQRERLISIAQILKFQDPGIRAWNLRNIERGQGDDQAGGGAVEDNFAGHA